MDAFTGFVAYDSAGNEIAREAVNIIVGPNTYATNWFLIKKSEIHTLSLFWRGIQKVSYNRTNDADFEWVFYHTGCLSIGSKLTILSRTIGFKNNKEKAISTVKENSGELTTKKECLL